MDGIGAQIGIKLDWSNLTVTTGLGGRAIQRVTAYLAAQTP